MAQRAHRTTAQSPLVGLRGENDVVWDELLDRDDDHDDDDKDKPIHANPSTVWLTKIVSFKFVSDGWVRRVWSMTACLTREDNDALSEILECFARIFKNILVKFLR